MTYSFLQVFDLTPDIARYAFIIVDFSLLPYCITLFKVILKFVTDYFSAN